MRIKTVKQRYTRTPKEYVQSSKELGISVVEQFRLITVYRLYTRNSVVEKEMKFSKLEDVHFQQIDLRITGRGNIQRCVNGTVSVLCD